MMLPAYLSVRDGGVCLALKVQPRASRNEIGEVLGKELHNSDAKPLGRIADIAAFGRSQTTELKVGLARPQVSPGAGMARGRFGTHNAVVRAGRARCGGNCACPGGPALAGASSIEEVKKTRPNSSVLSVFQGKSGNDDAPISVAPAPKPP